MKTKIAITFCILLIFSNSIVRADFPSNQNSGDKNQLGLADILTQVIGGIKPSAFTGGSSVKNDILGAVGDVASSDYVKYASLAGQLAGALKETSFLPGWASQKNGVLDQLKNAGDIADVASGLSGVLGNINPSSFKSSFKKKQTGLKTALDVMSKIK